MAVTQRGGHSPFSDPRLIILLALVAIWGAGALGVAVATPGQDAAGWPMGVATGKVHWSIGATVVAVLVLAALVAVIIFLRRLFKDDLKPYRIAAREMGHPKRLKHITEKAATATGKKLTPTLAATRAISGVLLGYTMVGNKPVYLDWESTMLVIAGPRMGKTTAVALPAIVTAPGAVITTSNKPDIYDDTVDFRRTKGAIWCFDPQNVAGATNMWWNPLRRVHDMPSALKLTGWLSTGAGNSAEANQQNKYFQDEGEKLLAVLILAAALGGGDLKHVYDWLKDIQTSVPLDLLVGHGFPDPAADLRAIQTMDAKQRDGVIGFARQPVGLLTHNGFAQYVTPKYRVQFGTDDSGLVTKNAAPGLHETELTEFIPRNFPDSTETLYALSLEGIGSAAGLVTALTGEVLEEAVDVANDHGGRLPIPLLACLDEAANICKLGELPKQYSHFGSRGIIPITILQSPAQARNVWGPDGWEALKSSSAIRYYGGNVDDDNYLGELSNKVGEHDVTYSSRSSSSSGPSYSTNTQREKILEVSDLAALPKELAVIQSPGNRPILVKKDFIFKNKELQDELARAAQVDGQTERTAQTV